MKKVFYIIGLSIVLFFSACKDKGQAQAIHLISPQEVYDAVYNSDAPQLVDVRTQEEFEEGHLKNSQNICVTDDDFKTKVAKLDKKKPVYVYCRSGKRSADAALVLKEMGFSEIYDMDGGIINWEEKGLETKN